MNAMTSTCEPVQSYTEKDFWAQRPRPVLLTDEATLCDWIAQAVPGASKIYFRGHLAYDRMPSSGTFREPERKRLIAVARQVLQAAEAGLVHLVQRRHESGDYSYIAVKAHARLKPQTSTAGTGVRRQG